MRDRVLDNAAIEAGDIVLDVGASDGLVAFGALDRIGDSGTVILGDISHDLLVHAAELSHSLPEANRCRFLRLSADQLPLGDGSVDAVTTRSVLIYLSAADKRRAVGEFHRILKPGGRISWFEPINSFAHPEPDHIWGGFDVSPVKDLAARLTRCGRRDQSPESHPLLDFDERDLLGWVEEAGFEPVHLDYEVEIGREPAWPEDWDSFVRSSGNPLDPTLEEAMDESFSPAEGTAL